MKKLFTLALCGLAVCSASAQKANVDQAKKLSGKIDKIEEARALLRQAMEDPSTAKDAQTYYIAGKLEFEAYDNALNKQRFNPEDKDVDPVAMAVQLLNGYNAFETMYPLDQLPNEKGQVKPKFTKQAQGMVNSHYDEYLKGGGALYNAKKYPEAYDAFMVFAELPTKDYASKTVALTPDSIRNLGYFNAGISAWAGNNVEDAVKAFRAARKNGSTNEQNYIYEIACWQYLAQNDSNQVDASKNEIYEIARDGYDKFGMEQPVFINNLINTLVLDKKYDEAISMIDGQIASYPENATLYGLRGFVNDRKGNDDASVTDYRKAVSLPDVSADILKNAAKKLFRVGVAKRENVNPNDAAAMAEIKSNYFLFAKDVAEKAKELDPKDYNINDVIENIDYVLESIK